MIIQGSPDILRGPQGLNGFGDFGSSPPPPSTDGGTVFDVCPPGSMMVDGVCVGDGGTPLPIPVPIPVPVPVPTPNTGISPMLILAAAAAAFFLAG